MGCVCSTAHCPRRVLVFLPNPRTALPPASDQCGCENRKSPSARCENPELAGCGILPQSALALIVPHLSSQMAINLLKVFIERPGISSLRQQEDQPAANERGAADDQSKTDMI